MHPKSKHVKDVMASNKSLQSGIMLADELPDQQDLEYVVMPKWWQDSTNTKGIPFRKYVVIAGDSDSGKTSASIAAIKAAQEQGFTCLYIETEGKTTKQDFKNWGVDTKTLNFYSESIAEDLYQEAVAWLKDRFKKNPEERIFVVIDSIGNVMSKHDAERDLSDSSARPGGKGKTNREGLNSLVALRTKGNMALLLITYTYDNMGSPGKTNAGGKAVNFFSSLTYQTSRKSWVEATVKGEKVRKGAVVQWKLFKNHLDRQNPGPKVIEFAVTAEGIRYLGKESVDEE